MIKFKIEKINNKSHLPFSVCKENINPNKNKQNNILHLLGKKRNCNCTNSKCNKNYCKCYSYGEQCNLKVCSCNNCCNYKTKINKVIKIRYSCSCKKSCCIKGYCQCYINGKKCNNECICIRCKNKSKKDIENNHFIYNKRLKKEEINNNKIIIDNYKLNEFNDS